MAWFAARDVTVERVLSDNGSAYRSHAWRDACAELGMTPKRTRPYRPQTNGKIERFHRTMASGWAFRRAPESDHLRAGNDRLLDIDRPSHRITAVGKPARNFDLLVGVLVVLDARSDACHHIGADIEDCVGADADEFDRGHARQGSPRRGPPPGRPRTILRQHRRRRGDPDIAPNQSDQRRNLLATLRAEGAIGI